MRALILGQSGQVAQALMQSRGGIEAQALGRPDIDLADPAGLIRAIGRIGPDIVINAAAYTAVDRAESAPEACFAINRDGAAAAAQAAADLAIPFLHLSTDFVFDGTKAQPYGEEDLPCPLNVYGQSKWAGEQAVRAAHPQAVIVRLSWVYAAQGHNFARTMVRLAQVRDEIGVVDDQWGRPTAAEDIAPALWRLAQALVAGPSPHQLYHLGAQGVASWADFADQIMAASRARGGPVATIRRITSADYAASAQRPARSVLDLSRLTRDWGVVLPDWRESCDRIVAQIVAGSA